MGDFINSFILINPDKRYRKGKRQSDNPMLTVIMPKLRPQAGQQSQTAKQNKKWDTKPNLLQNIKIKTPHKIVHYF